MRNARVKSRTSKAFLVSSEPLRFDFSPVATQRIYVPIEDAKLARLIELSVERNLTVESLIQEAVSEFLDERRGD
jgi:hypothetical protein